MCRLSSRLEPPPGNAQRAAKQTTKPNAAAAQDAAPDMEPEVVRISRQNLPQDPLRIAINNAIQKGMQEAKLNPAATQAMQNATGNAAQNATQTTVQNAAPNAASNLAPNTSTQQNTSPNAAQNGSPNTNSPPNTTPNANRAPNPKPPVAAPTGPIPRAINAGIEAMVSSKASLENAGNKWGGHKDKAIKLIDQALGACGQTPTPDNAGTKPSPANETAAMQAALTQLAAAQKHFMSAKNAWGGRRDQALALINQALTEVQAGIDFAKNHNTY